MTALGSALCIAAPWAASAQTVLPGFVIEAPDAASADGGQGTQGTALTKLQQEFAAMPGGVALLTAEDAAGRANITLADALSNVPGVVVQSFFGGNDQPRVQIRGSGLQQNPVERGLLVLQDGLPINRADGSYIVGFADPSSAEFIEIYRGYTANRLGATVLGGAVNFVSPTGVTSPGGEVTVEGGSFGQFTSSAAVGASEGNLDGAASVSFSTRDGFRDHNESERVNANVNAGARIDENITTRLFLGYTDLNFNVAGPLPKSWMEADPTQICTGQATGCQGPNVLRDDPAREATQFRVGSRITGEYGANLVDVAFGYAYTEDSFRFPISAGVRDTEGGDFTATARYAYSPDASQTLPLFEATALYVTGSADRDYYYNVRGEKGAQFGENELDASTTSLHAGFNVPIGEGITLSPAISYSYATRDSTDSFADIHNTNYERSYSGWSPSLALSYQLPSAGTLFTALSRSFEPPTHDDLLATRGGTPNTNPTGFSTPDLDAQTATTIEAGWRGKENGFAWDAVVYYSWVENEILSLRDAAGAPLGSINADKTTHFGVELGASKQLTDEIGVRLVYTYQDFRFDDDARHGDNKLAGAPEHIIKAAARYTFLPGLFVEVEADWVPTETPVDNANTLFNDEYVVVDLRANYDFSQSLSFYGEVRNVFDETYASSTLIVDTASGPNQAVFLPGDGRAFIVGLKGRF